MAGTVIRHKPVGATSGGLRSGIGRCLVAAFGLGAIAWAASMIAVDRDETGLADPAQHILQGDRYTIDQLHELQSRLNAAQGRSLSPAALSNAAVIWLRLVETALAADKTGLPVSSADELDKALLAAIAATPTASFLWLAEYWLQGIRTGVPARGESLLRLSYELGPNEGWIAQRRNRLALEALASLPDDLAVRVPVEFAGLVRASLYADAADILAGPGWAFRDRLMAALAAVDEGDRVRFARVLDARDLDGAIVPGLGDRPF